MEKVKVYIKIPRTGLGNMLLAWSRGYVFANLNDLPLTTSGWGGIRWGPWIRWERKKRLYWGCFKEDSRLERIRASLQKRTFEVVNEPEVGQIVLPENERVFFLFDQVAKGTDLFGPIRAHRALIQQGIRDILLPQIKQRLDKYDIPVIAVHIRRGDFKLGSPITPTDFFINCIKLANTVAGKALSVTVFTDAAPAEIRDVLALPNVTLAENKPDILDLLLISKSKIIVLSQSSTFSYWGAFLSDAIIIKPSGDWQDDLRPAEINENIFEGKVDFEDMNSVEKLQNALKNCNV